jgi:hypothetical protein
LGGSLTSFVGGWKGGRLLKRIGYDKYGEEILAEDGGGDSSLFYVGLL